MLHGKVEMFDSTENCTMPSQDKNCRNCRAIETAQWLHSVSNSRPGRHQNASGRNWSNTSQSHPLKNRNLSPQAIKFNKTKLIFYANEQSRYTIWFSKYINLTAFQSSGNKSYHLYSTTAGLFIQIVCVQWQRLNIDHPSSGINGY